VLKDADFANAAKLKKYDAIVTGIRSVNVEKRMAYWLPVLFEYAKNGGTLVMQYNTTQDMSTTKLGPYPFTIASDKRVTEEDAKITFIDPKSRLLNYPNKITDADFAGWVQERGLYFASKWMRNTSPYSPCMMKAKIRWKAARSMPRLARATIYTLRFPSTGSCRPQ